MGRQRKLPSVRSWAIKAIECGLLLLCIVQLFRLNNPWSNNAFLSAPEDLYNPWANNALVYTSEDRDLVTNMLARNQVEPNADSVREFLMQDAIVVDGRTAEDMADTLGQIYLHNEHASEMLKIRVNGGLSEEGAVARLLRPVHLWWTSGSTEGHTEATRRFFRFGEGPPPVWSYDPTPENDIAMLAMARDRVEPNAEAVRTYLLQNGRVVDDSTAEGFAGILGRIYFANEHESEMLKIRVNGGLSKQRALAAVSGPDAVSQKEVFMQRSNDRALRGAIEQNRRVTVNPLSSVDFGRMMSHDAARSIEGMHAFANAMEREREQAENFANAMEHEREQAEVFASSMQQQEVDQRIRQDAARSTQGMHAFVNAMERETEQAEVFASSMHQQANQRIPNQQEQAAEGEDLRPTSSLSALDLRPYDEASYVLHKMMGFESEEVSGDDIDVDSWENRLTANCDPDKAEEHKGHLRRVYDFAFNKLLPKMYRRFEETPVKLSDIPDQSTTGVYAMKKNNQIKIGQSGKGILGRVKEQVGEGINPKDAGKLVFDTEKAEELLYEVNLMDTVYDITFDGGVQAFGHHDDKSADIQGESSRLFVEAGVAACHEGYTHAVLDWLLKPPSHEIENLVKSPVDSSYDPEVVDTLRQTVIFQPIFTWITLPSYLEEMRESGSLSAANQRILDDKLVNTKDDGFLQNHLYQRNVGYSDRFLPYIDGVQTNARFEELQGWAEEMQTILDPHEESFLETGTVPESVTQELESVVRRFDKASGNGDPYLASVPAEDDVLNGTLEEMRQFRSNTPQLFPGTDAGKIAMTVEMWTFRRYADNIEALTEHFPDVFPEGTSFNSVTSFNGNHVGTLAITPEGPNVLFHYSQHVIAGKDNTVGQRKKGVERFIGSMSLFNKAGIVTDADLEEERSLSKSFLMRMHGLGGKWDGSVNTAIHYYLANGYNENHTGKGVTKCAKRFGPNGIQSLDALARGFYRDPLHGT